MLDRQPAAANKATQIDVLFAAHQAAFAKGDYAQALAVAQQARAIFNSPAIARSEALCLNRLGRGQEAYDIARSVIAPPDDEDYFDLMADICGALGRAAEGRDYGNAALAVRDRKFRNGPSFPIPDAPPRSDGKKVIAFSLFGNSPRYCEIAIMNCQAAGELLPDWQCRFYCDETVPEGVLQRIRQNGGEILIVDDATRRSIPAVMWRFLAADDPEISRFLMRDADSVVGAREAAAVSEWVESGRLFHVMRDYYTHTELILAGLWGGCGGVIPSMRAEMEKYISPEIFGSRYIDQHFLRKHIWPTARKSVLSHDSQFNFFNNVPFPYVPGASLDTKHHVGANLSTYSIGGPIEAPDGSLTLTIRTREGDTVCEYTVPIRNKRWGTPFPDHYANKIESGEWIAKLS
ncbi:MAG: hypothetical protein QM744_01615 [Mesorhizobium sp.]